ncbi:MAG TPA: insulinase family protein, partial [Puia sp.]|nr:insulinase family protein [Puia sp.]
IQATVDNMKFTFLEGLDNNMNRAYRLLSPYVVSGGDTWPSDVHSLDEMGKLTKQDIVDFANKWLGDNYVCIYKRKGEDKNIVKVVKPPITPVEVNRDAQSDFLKMVNSIAATPVKPQWLDYTKDFQKKQIGSTQILYVQNKDNEIFRLTYRFEMGSYNSKLLPIASQYLQFLGTGDLSSEDISRQFYNLACNFTINVTSEFSTITITGLQKNMEKATSLFEKLITECKPDEKALTSLKARILKTRTNTKLNKGAIQSGLRNYAMYGAKNPFNNQFTNEELNALQAKEIVDLLHGLFHYKHLIIYFGPKSLIEAVASIQKVHPIPTSFQPYPANAHFEKIAQTKNQVLYTNYDMVQAEISWVRNTTDYDPSKETMVEVFNEYYGGGMGSVVFQTLRESKALAYSTFAFYQEPAKKNDKYSMIGYIGCQSDKLDEAIGGMNDLLNNMPESQKLLETSKKSIKSSLETERFTEDAVIDQYL